MSVIHAPEDRPVELRTLIAPGILGLVLAGYFGRLWFLQVASSDDLRELADRSGEVRVSKLAPRGKIVDRNGLVIGGVRPTAVVTAVPRVALKDAKVIQKVAALLGIEPALLKKAIKDVTYAGDVAVPVYVGADLAAATSIAEMADDLPGFGVETQSMRFYASPFETGHIMGYVRTPGEKDVERLKAMGVQPAAYVGITGFEKQYETLLMGTPGSERVAVDARRQRLRSMGTDEPVPGSTAVLSLDLKLQTLANELLKGRRGSVVALDPRNGEVLCLASSPTYDSSKFLKGISQDDYDALQNDPSKPLFFRATGAVYPPGSTFKIVTTAAAWLTDKFSLSSTTFCPGYVQVGNRKIACLSRHGSVAYDVAFTKSCNTYFGHLATVVGRDALLKACDAFGLGKKTGLDIPGERKGTVPTEEWWAKHRERRWSLGDTVNFGIGQGELAVTPLQMANVVAMVANRGRTYAPHLLKATVGPGEGAVSQPYEPQLSGTLEARPDQWDALTRAMFHVVQSGTARNASITGLDWGGKTGSAENRKDHETHSWFVGMAPIEAPEIVLCIMVENAGHGSEVAAPIAKQIVQYWLIDRKKKPQSANLGATLSTQETDAESPD